MRNIILLKNGLVPFQKLIPPTSLLKQERGFQGYIIRFSFEFQRFNIPFILHFSLMFLTSAYLFLSDILNNVYSSHLWNMNSTFQNAFDWKACDSTNIYLFITWVPIPKWGTWPAKSPTFHFLLSQESVYLWHFSRLKLAFEKNRQRSDFQALEWCCLWAAVM